MAYLLEIIRKDMRMHEENDRSMSTAWLLVYVLAIIICVMVSVYTGLSFLEYFSSIDFSNPQSFYSYDAIPEGFVFSWLMIGITVLIDIVAFIVIIYLLITRRNNHFKRQKILFEDITAYTNFLAKSKNIDLDSIPPSLEHAEQEETAKETDKSAILWAILSAFIPFLQLYVYYFLMKDFYMHERREDNFWEDLGRTMTKLDTAFSPPRRTETTPDRDFVLYLILLIVTMGFFGVYWIYVLLNDPNEHFNYHKCAEKQLLDTLGSIEV